MFVYLVTTLVKHTQVLVNSSVVKFTFEVITALHTFNDFDGVKTFLSDDNRKKFRGFGKPLSK